MPDGDTTTLDLVYREQQRRAALRQTKLDCEADLLSFVRAFWHVLEPETPLVEGWTLGALCDLLMAVTDGHLNRVIINIPPGFMKSLMLSVFWPAWEWGPSNLAHLRYISASYSASLTERDNGRLARLVTDETYQRMWGDRVKLTKDGVGKLETKATGWKLATSVGGTTTGERGDRVLIDDANNPATVESEAVRETTNRWLTEVMPDRLNNIATGVIINLQQRTHEQDATGTLAERGTGYVWWCVPMEFDPLRNNPCTIRWDENGTAMEVLEDPRGLDALGMPLEGLFEDERGEFKVRMGSPLAKADGALAWPERFPPDEVAKLRTIKGPYAWCTPAESPILMADLTMKPIGQVRDGDQIVGWETDVAPRREGERHARRRLTPAVVTAVHRSVRPVVRITLDSGKVVRCTADHRWYTGRSPNDASHPVYAPAKIGRSLMRVCDAELPQLTSAHDLRLAGWLGGFFDGEGTVSIQNRRHRMGEQSTGLISFAQGSGRNGPMCDKLEYALTHFGFPWSYAVKRSEDTHDLRMYWLRRNGLPTYQRFLHIVQPVKWRERIIQVAMGANFIQGEERVVLIEPDGEEDVFGLTTTTGNYVVWGLASSNSGQYQQTPTVRGGGIIRRDWWQAWTAPDFPDLGTVVAGLDTAIKESEENDYNAFQTWGAFPGPGGEPKMIITSAWKLRCSLAELVARVAESCWERKVDYLLIEDKARGTDVAAEIIRQFSDAPWQTVLIPVNGRGAFSGDKVARLQAVAPLFSGDVRRMPAGSNEDGTQRFMDVWSGGMIYAPDRTWADEVVTEVANFPRGAHDDQVDVVSMVLSWVRRNGVVLRKIEYERNELDAKKYRRTPSLPYAIGR